MSRSAISHKVAVGDVAKKHVKITAVWGKYSCQLMIDREILCNEDSSILLEDVVPYGPWQKSLNWMGDDIEDAAEKGVLTSLSKLKLPKDKGKYLDKFAKTVRVYCIVIRAVKKFAALVKTNLKSAERFNSSFQSNYLEQKKSLT